MTDWSAGEVGGIFAGAVAALAAFGKGIAWLLNWQGARSDTRAAKYDAWEKSLIQREKDYREKIEHKLNEIEEEMELMRGQQNALGFSLLEVTIELRQHVQTSPALSRAAAALRKAFPIEYEMPPEMAELVRALDGQGENDGSSRR